MIYEFSKHKLVYSVLLAGVLIFILAFMAVWPDKRMQQLIAVAFSIFYFLWGVLTHLKTKCFSKEVVYEYGGVSLLAGVLLIIITI